jgi:enoyl-CoA hydratase
VFTDGEGVSAAGGDQYARAEAFRQFVLTLQNSFNCLDNARMPVIAAIQGGCIGAGVDMTSACDIRYCTQDAFFQIAEINIAMTADVGTFPRLCKLIPEGWVRELAYSGRRLPAAKAKEIGLVNEVFATQEAMMAHVMALAGEIAEKSPLAVAGSKRMINYARDHAIADALDYIATWQAGMFSPPHMAEAFAAKAQKRAAVFPDLAPLKKEM